MSRRSCVVLLREGADPDPYVAALDAAGFDARCIPVLRFEPAGHDKLPVLLSDAERFAALVLTSSRAAEALDGHDLSRWKDKPAFVVGERTAARVQALGLRSVGEASGSASALAGVIVERAPAGPVLFLCGDRRRDDLPDRLRASSVPIEELVVYRTIQDVEALKKVDLSAAVWVAFFSPSGVEAALECDDLSWNSLRRAAIGPTTAEALRAAAFPPHAVAATPMPEALATAISHAHRSADV